MLEMPSFLTEVPEWTQPPKPPQDGTDLIRLSFVYLVCFKRLGCTYTSLVQGRWDHQQRPCTAFRVGVPPLPRYVFPLYFSCTVAQ
jgi:hypothetical protein